MRGQLWRIITFLTQWADYNLKASMTADNFYIRLEGGESFYISRNCIYLDLFLLTAPFLLSFRRSLLNNVLHLTAFFIIISTINIIRVFAAFCFYNSGVPWSICHSIPDIVLHISIVVFYVYRALKIDFKISNNREQLAEMESPA